MRRITRFAILGVFLSVGAVQAQDVPTVPPAPRAPRAPRITVPRTPRTPTPPRAVDAPINGCGFLGIYPNDIGRKTVEKLGLGERTGAIIIGVVENTGASRAGIQEKDVVTAFNGEFITSESQLRRLIMSQTPGTMVRLDLFRNGTTLTVNAEITARSKYYRGAPDCNTPSVDPQTPQRLEQQTRDAVKDLDISMIDRETLDRDMHSAAEELRAAQIELRGSLADFREQRNMTVGYEGNTGIGLQKMSLQLAEYFRTGTTTGALVNDVADKSPAARAGMQAGDVIVGVNGLAIAGPMDAVKGIVDDTDGSVDVRVIRDGQERAMQIRTKNGTNARTPNVLPDIGAHTAPQRELLRLAGQNLQ